MKKNKVALFNGIESEQRKELALAFVAEHEDLFEKWMISKVAEFMDSFEKWVISKGGKQ